MKIRILVFILLSLTGFNTNANETQCVFIENNTYWKESVNKCRYDCVFNYRHEINVFMGGENNLGSVRGSNDTEFSYKNQKFDDRKIKDDYYTLFKGDKIRDGIYEVCSTKKSDAYKKKKERLEAEEKMKNDIKSIPNFFKELFLGGLM